MRLLQKEHLLIFQSTLPDPRSRAPVTAIARFQSTLPERGETLLPFSPARRGEVFQSTLPAWGETPPRTACRPLPPYFNPLSPHGERHFRYHGVHCGQPFQSTLPAGGETAMAMAQQLDAMISIHSPRMGRDTAGSVKAQIDWLFQSTLPAWGETVNHPLFCRWPLEFQSTLPAWGETLPKTGRSDHKLISIHSPRLGRDRKGLSVSLAHD